MSLLEHAASGELCPDELEDLLEDLLNGRIAVGTAAAVLQALVKRPLTAELLVAGAAVLRRNSVPVEAPVNRTLIDTCGTGGDGLGTVNLSTGAALLVAACDGTVAKQGQGALSGQCGSVDVLQALHIPVDLHANGATTALERTGFALLQTTRFHPALTRVLPLLTTPGARSLISILLPLANPSFPECQLVGVYDPALTSPMALALGLLGADRALVVHCGGLDELGLHADTIGHSWIDGRLRPFHHPGVGIPLQALAGGDATENAARLARAFEGQRGPLADAVALNAGAALWIGGMLPTLGDARRWARDRLSQGIDLDDFRA
jgi:anthranilate phosphoribosyltransferase